MITLIYYIIFIYQCTIPTERGVHRSADTIAAESLLKYTSVWQFVFRRYNYILYLFHSDGNRFSARPGESPSRHLFRNNNNNNSNNNDSSEMRIVSNNNNI